ncbi:hypothetical protein BH10PAT1_BH10PAT1_7910 [soil metagenome]
MAERIYTEIGKSPYFVALEASLDQLKTEGIILTYSFNGGDGRGNVDYWVKMDKSSELIPLSIADGRTSPKSFFKETTGLPSLFVTEGREVLKKPDKITNEVARKLNGYRDAGMNLERLTELNKHWFNSSQL